MIKIENVKVYGINDTVRRAKYPMSTDINKLSYNLTDGIEKLFKSPKGEGHDQALTGVVVQFDLTCPVKMWTEIQRYHWIDFVSSQSTMHRITRFDLDKQYDGCVDKRIIEIMKELVTAYNEHAKTDGYPRDKLKEEYLEILMSNPCGFNLTAGITTNYRQLKTIYSQRKNHRLPHWRQFCEWLTTLPDSDWITGESV